MRNRITAGRFRPNRGQSSDQPNPALAAVQISMQPRSMKLATFSLACPLLLLVACQNREAKIINGMSGPEKAAYLAMERYHICYTVLVQKAKTERRGLSDDQLRRLGYRCPAELQRAAEAVDRYWMSDKHKHRDDPAAYSPDRSVRVTYHKNELAGAFACEFTSCHLTD